MVHLLRDLVIEFVLAGALTSLVLGHLLLGAALLVVGVVLLGAAVRRRGPLSSGRASNTTPTGL